ncbi:MAG: hypothetical protein AMXMBFR56_41200 [Polyangiaceae bacterium]
MRTRARTRSRLLRDLGRRIAELRQARGFTQDGFSERVGVSLRYIQSVEGGRENLTVETLEKLAKVLRAPVAELFVPPTSRVVRRGRPPKTQTGTT